MAFDQDEEWQNLIKDITPLKKIDRDISKPKKQIEVRPKISANRVYSGNKLESLEIGCSDNVDANTFKNFKSGKMRVEAELDLHGYSESEAFDRVMNFIKNAYLKSWRCVEIITGKGLHAENESFFEARGVLKDRVPQWLNLPEIRALILAVVHPEANKGGSGVLRILMRRKRD